MRATRRTIRTAAAAVAAAAAAAVAAVAALALPAGAAFAETPATPRPQVLPGQSEPKTVRSFDTSVEMYTVGKGGVKAGAEGVAGPSRAPVIAAGGGMAAAGAAGVGFAMLHRRGR